MVFDTAVSDMFDVPSGVPQGSHLGPSLFLLFINDLASVVENSLIIKFADDVKICSHLGDTTLLQIDLDNIYIWCKRNLMSLNLNKCKHMAFSWRSCINSVFFIDGIPISRVETIKDLGVVFDPKLKFHLHIEHISHRASSMLGFVKRWGKEFRDPYITKLLYTSLVRSILEYASVVWHPHYNIHIDLLESVQKQFLLFALRHLFSGPMTDLPPYEARLKLIDLPTIQSRRILMNVCFIFKLVTNEVESEVLLNKLCFNVPVRPSRHFQPLQLTYFTRNYLNFDPLRSACNDFNKYIDFSDFGSSLRILKQKLALHLNNFLN
mgnify:CR=1 FL=1